MQMAVSTGLSTQSNDPLPWGLQQEELLRQGLAASPELLVTSSVNLDRIFKADLVLRDKFNDDLPWVAVQVTTRRHAPEKVQQTFETLRATRAFARLIYLILALPASRPEIVPALAKLLRQVAAYDAEGMFVVQLDETGGQVRTRIMQTMLFNAPLTGTAPSAKCMVKALDNERPGAHLLIRKPGWRKSCVDGF